MGTHVFKTSDPPDAVMAFYREKLDSDQASFMETPDGGIITSSQGKKKGFMITVGRDRSNNGSAISITRTK